MLSRIIKWIRYFFGISRTEANGVIVLALIMVFVAFLPYVVNKATKKNIPDFEEQEGLDSLIALLDQNLFPDSTIYETTQEKSDSIMQIPFDPNEADFYKLKSIGFTNELSNRIIKYRENGGVFRKKEDLRKIYGITEEEFNKLQPFILIDSKNRFEEITHQVKSSDSIKIASGSKSAVHFDLNKADSSEMIIVNGVGRVISSRIVKFREALGGFVKIDQLHEVYGLEDYAFQNLAGQAYIEENFKPRTIPINKWPADSLARHPYIDFNKARVIVAYREQHGDFQKPEDLLDVLVLNEDFVTRITPYLEF